ncbi:MAG: hypothetical protein IPH82_13375 [Chloroflexi bacterium]|nr:hypothetical protein [Chloroflexota bacterium]
MIREQSAQEFAWQGMLEVLRPYLETPDQVRRACCRWWKTAQSRVHSVRDNESTVAWKNAWASLVGASSAPPA